MLQGFEATTRPADGPPRLAALRGALAEAGLQGFLVPRADAFQGEYVADRDARLAWLTGFTGSAGFCAVLPEIAGLFVDGRYRVQAREQVDTGAFTPIDWPATDLADWLKAQAPAGAAVGFDPWLHTVREIETLHAALEDSGVTLSPHPTPIDALWTDRPAAPGGAASAHAEAHAGRSAADKRMQVAADLRAAGDAACVLTQPDSIAWLLNIRGTDIPRIPIVQAFAIVHADGSVDLFAAPAKVAHLADWLGPDVRLHPQDAFADALRTCDGQVRLDRNSAPMAVKDALEAGPATCREGRDPCLLPKACKTEAEIAGAEAAHLRDGAAMAEFLCWLDAETATLAADPGHRVTEIDTVRALEAFRKATGALRDIAFETIAGAGPHAALPHYRVTEASDRALAPGEVFLVDSGGQYGDGTTDITRTIAVGTPPDAARAAFTRVLKGLIAISRARFPKGIAGRDLDALARMALWQAGQDYDHGTGHGVGSYLSVHEGPQRLARSGTEPLAPGMILSNEPGYYREGAFGIRLENLIVVAPAPSLPEGDDREMLTFRTLTHVPFDRRVLVPEMLDADERAWLDAYHAETWRRLSPRVSESARAWLRAATAPL